LGTLIERVGELCFRGVEDLIHSLERKQLPMTNGVSYLPSNRPDVNQLKKKEVMDFAHLQRSKFIKLMVLVKWSEQAAKHMAKMIDMKVWALELAMQYELAADQIALLKRGLQEFKLRSPDMETALAVLSTGKVPWMPDVCVNELSFIDSMTNDNPDWFSSLTTAQSEENAEGAE
jgi:mediator of RNA polymerase II transcription subunit 14